METAPPRNFPPAPSAPTCAAIHPTSVVITQLHKHVHRYRVSQAWGACVHIRSAHGRASAVLPRQEGAQHAGALDSGSGAHRVYLKDMSRDELRVWLSDSLGEDPKRADILWKWLYRDQHWAAKAEDMAGVSASFRQKLEDSGAHFDSLEYAGSYLATDGTRKILFRLRDGSDGPHQALIETVLIPHASRSGTPLELRGILNHTRDDSAMRGVEAEGGGKTPRAGAGAAGGALQPTRYTICVSSQLGCAMNCQFCFTAKMGLRQNLRVGQIVDQVVQVRRMFAAEVGGISNVVFMGMGEPLHNLESVVAAVNTLTDEWGLHCSPRRTTVSTSGLVPEMHEYCRRTRGSLALSLHATTDEVRSMIMPINKKHSIQQLMECLKLQFGAAAGRRRSDHVLVEYLLLKGINDSAEDARRLCLLTSSFSCKINLITFNAFPGAPFEPTPENQAREFQELLIRLGAKAFLRRSRGDDAMAACGQLGNKGRV